MEVELSILEAEVPDRARWHEPTFDVARLRMFADENIAFLWELGFQPFLLVLLVRTKCLAYIYLFERVAILLQQHAFAIACVGATAGSTWGYIECAWDYIEGCTCTCTEGFASAAAEGFSLGGG